MLQDVLVCGLNLLTSELVSSLFVSSCELSVVQQLPCGSLHVAINIQQNINDYPIPQMYTLDTVH